MSFILLLANFAFATGPATNYYQAVVDFYNKGIAPSPGELEGAWTGRCYDMDNPSIPVGSIRMHR